MTNALQEHLVEAGFHDHRVVHHNVMAHVTYDGVRTTELAQRAGITKQAMSELVRDLVSLGYLQSGPDPTDGRAKLITFSVKGRRAVSAAMKAFGSMEQELAAAVGAEAMQILRHSLLGLLDTPLDPGAVRRGRPRRRG